MEGNAHRIRYAVALIAVAVWFSAPSIARAATMFLAPSTGNFAINKNFAVTIRVNSQGAAINAAEGTLSFDPARLQVVSVTTAGSVFNLNVMEPQYSNANGTVTWAGVILNPGYTGASGALLTVTFKGTAQGAAAVKFASGAVLANDGQGTNVLNGMSGAVYTIGTAPAATPTSAPASGPSATPVVTSATHPEQDSWYATNDPKFSWTLPEGSDGVSYLVNPKESANPGNTSDGAVDSAEFDDVAEGRNFFHVKFLSEGTWGPIAHFAFNTDTGVPEPFSLTRVDADDSTNPQPQLSYATDDGVSGVTRYLMRIGDGDWFEVPSAPTGQPYAMPLQAPGAHEVTVEAFDRAGNSSRASLTVEVTSIEPPVITAWPPEADEMAPFRVAGSAKRGMQIKVETIRVSGWLGRVLSGASTTTTYATTGDSGTWTATVAGLPDGLHAVVARAVDDRGAISHPSNEVEVRVGYTFLWRLWDFLRGVPAWLWVLFLLILLSFLFFFLFGKRRRRPVGSPSGDPKVVSKLQELQSDIDDEIALLDRLAAHRPLYPEEKYLRSKLTEYRKTTKFLLQDSHSKLKVKPRKP